MNRALFAQILAAAMPLMAASAAPSCAQGADPALIQRAKATVARQIDTPEAQWAKALVETAARIPQATYYGPSTQNLADTVLIPALEHLKKNLPELSFAYRLTYDVEGRVIIETNSITDELQQTNDDKKQTTIQMVCAKYEILQKPSGDYIAASYTPTIDPTENEVREGFDMGTVRKLLTTLAANASDSPRHADTIAWWQATARAAKRTVIKGPSPSGPLCAVK